MRPREYNKLRQGTEPRAIVSRLKYSIFIGSYLPLNYELAIPPCIEITIAASHTKYLFGLGK